MVSVLKRYSLPYAFALLFVAMCWVFARPTSAEGVFVSLNVTSVTTALPANSVTVYWTHPGNYSYVTGTEVTITITPAITFVSSSYSLDLDGVNSFDTVFTGTTTANNTSVLTARVVTSTASQTGFSFPLTDVLLSSASQNYSFAVTAASTTYSNHIDFGAALMYVNGGNQVNITATVPASLSFRVRDAGDNADTNSCAMGTLSAVSTGTCAYRLRIATNAAGGFTALVSADHDFGTGNATLTNYVEDGTFPTPGVEMYGFEAVSGATSGGHNTSTGAFDKGVYEQGYFADDASPVPLTATSIIAFDDSFFAGPTSTPTTTATTYVKHFANIDGSTQAGSYQQTVTYTVTASF